MSRPKAPPGEFPRWALVALLLGALAASGCAHGSGRRRPAPSVPLESAAHVRVEGARKLRASALKSRLVTRATPLYPLTRDLRLRRAYRGIDRDELALDAQRIEALYRTEGFLKGSVRSVRVVPARPRGREGRPGAKAPDTRWFDVVFQVKEGPRSRIRTVTVEGLAGVEGAAHQEARIRRRLAPGHRFRYADYDATKAELLAFLQQQGHAWARVDGEVRAEAPKDRVDLVVSVHPGPLATFGALRIQGNRKVPRRFVLAQSWLDAGDAYSPRALLRLQGDLYDLGTFSTVSVRPDLSAPDSGVVPVDVSLREADPRLFQVSVGLNLEPDRDQALVSVTLEHRNAFRRAVRLKSLTEGGYAVFPGIADPAYHGPVAGQELSITLPHTPLPRFQASLTGKAWLEQSYGYLTFHPELAVTLAATPARRTTLALTWRLEQYLYDNDSDILTEEEIPDFASRYRLASLQPSFSWRTDVPGAPGMKGGFADLVFVLGGVPTGSEWSWTGLNGRVGGYIPLIADRLALAGRFQAGFVRGLPGTTVEGIDSAVLYATPPSERFLLGGGDTVRGWGRDMLGPRAGKVDCADGDTACTPDSGQPVGGNSMVAASVEVRGYLRFGLGAAAFVDVGRVWSDDFGAPTDLALSVGAGLRFRSPIGPLRLDVGFPLARGGVSDIGLPGYALHFGIGEAF